MNARLEALRLARADGDLRHPHQIVEKAAVYLAFLEPQRGQQAEGEPEPVTFGELRTRAAGVLEVLAEHHSWLVPQEIEALRLAIADLRATRNDGGGAS